MLLRLSPLVSIFMLMILFCNSCNSKKDAEPHFRQVVDVVGFSHQPNQIDSVISRINQHHGRTINHIFDSLGIDKQTAWKTAICPHDDHGYAGWLYPLALTHIKAPIVIIFGVAHKARNFGLEDFLIFDDFDGWESADGIIPISGWRDEIVAALPEGSYTVNDSMQTIEHSVESMLPFLQKQIPDLQIVPILIPYMCFDRMQELAGLLANAIQKVSQPRNAVWGRDFTLLITTDAVHYGDEDWGGKNFARYGTDSSGYQQAIEHEYEIISNCLTGQVDPEKMKRFNQYTVEDDCKTYKWTWCGRFSIPLGLLTANNLQMLSGDQNLTGTFLGYANSIDHPRLEVEDIGLGFTAPAHLRHWVGYVAVGYR